MEGFKRGTLETFPPEIYFWRTKEKIEINVVTVKDIEIKGYECKWSDQKVMFTKFKQLYPNAHTHVVAPDSLLIDLYK